MTAAAERLKRHLGDEHPAFAIVLGSSLGGLADGLDAPRTLSYSELPGFPVPSVSGHAGELAAGRLGGKPVLMLKGRALAYEHGDGAAMRPLIETLAACGIKRLVLTNAAGSLRPEVGPGSIMLITDHINLSGLSPLFGETGDERFVSLTNAYDNELANKMRAAARPRTCCWPKAFMLGSLAPPLKRQPRSAWRPLSARTLSACRPRPKPSLPGVSD